MTLAGGAVDPLAPYVPRYVADWLAEQPGQAHRRLAATLVFADISGFTALTERLAESGPSGAEEMGDLLNETFDPLLHVAWEERAHLLKWGGDAILLMVEGAAHADRAARVAWRMQQIMRATGRVTTSRGGVQLRMSIGVHTGDVDLLLVGSEFLELVVTGPAATATARAEKAARAGEIVLTPAAADALGAGVREVDGRLLLVREPAAVAPPEVGRRPREPDLGQLFCTPLREHLRAGVAQYEHRHVVVGFVFVSGLDVAAAAGVEGMAAAVAEVVERAQAAAAAGAVTVLSTDLAEDGFKIILVAGAPTAHGDEEARMLAAVRAIVAPSALGLRAGIAEGRVYIGDYGGVLRRVWSMTGDIVNLAARLGAVAAPGQVLVTPEVVAASRTSYDVERVPPLTLKGKQGDVTALALRGESPAVRSPETGSFVGRSRELEMLLALADAAAEGQGAVIDLVGEAGLGKSRLVRELIDRSVLRVLSVSADVFDAARPYHGAARLLSVALSPGLARVPAPVLVAAVRRHAPALEPWLAVLAPLVAGALDDTPATSSLDAEGRKHHRERVLVELLAATVRPGTLVVIEDLQFIDDASADAFAQLARVAARQGWLFVSTRRAAGRRLAASSTEVVLAPLDHGESEALVAELGGTHAPRVARQAAANAGGNPLFLISIMAGLAAGADIDDLPDSIEHLIAAQIDQLDAGRRDALRAVSVLGVSFADEAVAALGDEVARAVDDLTPFVAPAGRGRWSFSHGLVQLAAYGGLTYRRRRSLHGQVADQIAARGDERADDAGLLALHSLRAQRFEDAWHWGCVAGRRAADQYALADAIRAYEHALAGAERTETVLPVERGRVAAEVARMHEARGDASAGLAICAVGRRLAKPDPLVHAELCRITAECEMAQGRHERGLRWRARGRAALRAQPESPAVSRTLAWLTLETAVSWYDQRDPARFRRWTRRAIEAAERSEDPALIAYTWALDLAARAWTGLPITAAEIERVIEIAGGRTDSSTYGLALDSAATAAIYSGHWDVALRLFEETHDVLRRIGHDIWAASALAYQGLILARQGHADRARPLAAAALANASASENRRVVVSSLMAIGEAELAGGSAEAAVVHLREAVRTAQEVRTSQAYVESATALIRGLLTLGRVEEAAELVERVEVVEWRDLWRSEPLLLLSRGMVLIARGRREAGVTDLREALRAALDGTNPYFLSEAFTSLLCCDAADSGAEEQAWRDDRGLLLARLAVDADAADRHRPRFGRARSRC